MSGGRRHVDQAKSSAPEPPTWRRALGSWERMDLWTWGKRWIIEDAEAVVVTSPASRGGGFGVCDTLKVAPKAAPAADVPPLNFGPTSILLPVRYSPCLTKVLKHTAIPCEIPRIVSERFLPPAGVNGCGAACGAQFDHQEPGEEELQPIAMASRRRGS
eukprot:scaffold7814_cov296-Pinguiococcus_pyrenoidosus.AAC.2